MYLVIFKRDLSLLGFKLMCYIFQIYIPVKVCLVYLQADEVVCIIIFT